MYIEPFGGYIWQEHLKYLYITRYYEHTYDMIAWLFWPLLFNLFNPLFSAFVSRPVVQNC